MEAIKVEQLGPEYKYHHSASRRGYCPNAAEGDCEPYKGRYGAGYVARSKYWLGNGHYSTQYERIAYYIKEA